MEVEPQGGKEAREAVTVVVAARAARQAETPVTGEEAGEEAACRVRHSLSSRCPSGTHCTQPRALHHRMLRLLKSHTPPRRTAKWVVVATRVGLAPQR